MYSFSLRLIVFLVLPLFLFSSCTVQKRTYNSGFNVNWHVNIQKNKSNKFQEKITLSTITTKPIISNKNTLNHIPILSKNDDTSTKLKLIKKEKKIQKLIQLNSKPIPVKLSTASQPKAQTMKTRAKIGFVENTNSKARINLPKMKAYGNSLGSSTLLIILGVLLAIFGFIFIGPLISTIPPGIGAILVILMVGTLIYFWVDSQCGFGSFIT